MGEEPFKLAQGRYVITLDDDPLIGKIIEQYLRIKSVNFSSVEALRRSMDRYRPTAVFVDVHIGIEENGLDLVPVMKERWPYSPVLVLTSDPDEALIARALSAGAHDFVTKPLRPKELLARFQTRIADLSQARNQNVLRVGDVQVDLSQRLTAGPKGQHPLSQLEINLLRHLIQAKGTTVTRDVLKRKGWGGVVVSESSLDRKIHDLRNALGSVSERVKIRNIYRKGFVLSAGDS